MFLSSVTSVLCLSHSFNLLYTVGMRVRTALTAAIYRKVARGCLKLGGGGGGGCLERGRGVERRWWLKGGGGWREVRGG